MQMSGMCGWRTEGGRWLLCRAPPPHPSPPASLTRSGEDSLNTAQNRTTLNLQRIRYICITQQEWVGTQRVWGADLSAWVCFFFVFGGWKQASHNCERNSDTPPPFSPYLSLFLSAALSVVSWPSPSHFNLNANFINLPLKRLILVSKPMCYSCVAWTCHSQ